MKKIWIDPPSGWRWGFPKVYDRLTDGDDIHAWMVAQGYPQAEIDRLGDSFYVRSWEAQDDHEPSFLPGLPTKVDR
jgi:hypothetical protein